MKSWSLTALFIRVIRVIRGKTIEVADLAAIQRPALSLKALASELMTVMR
jgi:hypothetical protein